MKVNQMALIYSMIVIAAAMMTVGNIFLKVYDFQKASLILQPIIIMLIVGWWEQLSLPQMKTMLSFLGL